MTETLHIIIAGGGEVGLGAARVLDDRGHNVTIIEPDPSRADYLSDAYVGTVIEGDAARPSVLAQANLERSDVVAALTDDEASNFAVCMAAQRMATVRTVLRTSAPPGEEYDAFVDGTVFPEAFGARAAANEITGAGVRAIEEIGGELGLEIVEVEVTEAAPAAGRSLQEVSFPRGSLIIADAAGGRIGGPDTVLEPGVRYLVAMEADVADEIMNLLRG
ncbi:potassium channel family protein [Haloglomus litoreum]|uniref:potassium channel family protein n=1 Tax=Haloglomus litoreum TaxID=3034026 RepID=UPI0023E8EA87|nr:TrkA family potassium uptake protein [Haloglomus sp. DT116]